MDPAQAMQWITGLLDQGRIRGIDIRGPGDALADPEHLLRTVELIREKWPGLAIRITTIGLGAAQMAVRLAGAGIREVVMEVNAVDSGIVQRLYAWIRPGRRTIPLAEAASQLVREQDRGTEELVRAGIRVRVMSTVYPGINDHHLGEVAARMALSGAASIAVFPFADAPPAPAGHDRLPPCDSTTLARARGQAAAHLPLAGEEPEKTESRASLVPLRDQGLPGPTPERPHVAVASSNGMDIDLHLGQADRLLIYGPREDGLACLLEPRQVTPAPAGVPRWQNLARECLHDCFAVLAADAGEAPKKALRRFGVRVIACSDNIEGTVDVLFGGGRKHHR